MRPPKPTLTEQELEIMKVVWQLETATVRQVYETMLEYRRDWSNHDFFPRGKGGILLGHQDTATLGLVWWYGGKQGAW